MRTTAARCLREARLQVVERVPSESIAMLSLLEPDILVVDLSKDTRRGLELCNNARSTTGLPILGLLATSSEPLELMCLAAGASAVHTATPTMLAARVRALLPPRSNAAARGTVSVGPLTLDRDARRLACDGHPVPLSRVEFAIVEMLMSRPNHVIEREAMVRIGWEGPCSGRALESTISRLRCKVRAAGGPTIAVAMHGVGYRLGID